MVQFHGPRINRKVPLLDPRHYKSYGITAPLASHWRRATCAEYECADYVHGFVATIDTGTELGQRQFDYLTHDKERKYSMQRVSLTTFKFVYGPGNRCFKSGEHRVPIGRPPLLLVHDGDWRGNPTGNVVRHTRVENWVEDFAEHQSVLAERIRRM
jgi:hypothetical protein